MNVPIRAGTLRAGADDRPVRQGATAPRPAMRLSWRPTAADLHFQPFAIEPEPPAPANRPPCARRSRPPRTAAPEPEPMIDRSAKVRPRHGPLCASHGVRQPPIFTSSRSPSNRSRPRTRTGRHVHVDPRPPRRRSRPREGARAGTLQAATDDRPVRIKPEPVRQGATAPCAANRPSMFRRYKQPEPSASANRPPAHVDHGRDRPEPRAKRRARPPRNRSR